MAALIPATLAPTLLHRDPIVLRLGPIGVRVALRADQNPAAAKKGRLRHLRRVGFRARAAPCGGLLTASGLTGPRRRLRGGRPGGFLGRRRRAASGRWGRACPRCPGRRNRIGLSRRGGLRGRGQGGIVRGNRSVVRVHAYPLMADTGNFRPGKRCNGSMESSILPRGRRGLQVPARQYAAGLLASWAQGIGPAADKADRAASMPSPLPPLARGQNWSEMGCLSARLPRYS